MLTRTGPHTLSTSSPGYFPGNQKGSARNPETAQAVERVRRSPPPSQWEPAKSTLVLQNPDRYLSTQLKPPQKKPTRIALRIPERMRGTVAAHESDLGDGKEPD